MSNVVSSLNLYINTSCGSWNDTGLSPPAHGPSWDSLNKYFVNKIIAGLQEISDKILSEYRLSGGRCMS